MRRVKAGLIFHNFHCEVQTLGQGCAKLNIYRLSRHTCLFGCSYVLFKAQSTELIVAAIHFKFLLKSAAQSIR